MIVEDNLIIAEDIKHNLEDLRYKIPGIVSTEEEAIQKNQKMQIGSGFLVILWSQYKEIKIIKRF